MKVETFRNYHLRHSLYYNLYSRMSYSRHYSLYNSLYYNLFEKTKP